MSDKSKIEWTDASWNPVTGCTKVSPGCDHCYAERFSERWRGIEGHPYEQGFDLKLHPHRLEQPVRWKKPRRIFVNSMSDLFHSRVPAEYVKRVIDVMRRAPQHTFQTLTKRPRCMDVRLRRNAPLPANSWWGVSIESSDYLWRIDYLRDAPAAIRFLSCEPLIGPIEPDLTAIHWVIAGGESGPGARPMDPAWARSLRDQCWEEGVPFFMKQMAKKAPIPPDLRVRQFPELLT